MNRNETYRTEQQIISSENQFTYEHFASQPEYVKVNRELIQIIAHRLPDNFFHVDVATGTGLVPQLIIEEVYKDRKGKIIGIDPNSTSLDIARRKNLALRNVPVEFIEGFGQDLEALVAGKIPKDGVDSVSIHDALHEIRDEEDKINVVKSMANILKLGGLFSFNSAFTTEAIKVDPRGWAGWKLKAMEILGGERDRQTAKLAIHTPEKYVEMMTNAGLTKIHAKPKIVNLSKEALKAISVYPAFIRGVFEDMRGNETVSENDKSYALKQALDDKNIVELPRVWYEIVAQKNNSPADMGSV